MMLFFLIRQRITSSLWEWSLWLRLAWQKNAAMAEESYFVNRGLGGRLYISPSVFLMTRLLVRSIVSGVLLVTLVVGSYFMVSYWLLSGTPDPKNQAFLMALHQYRTAIAVRDKQGHLLGVMANDKPAPAEYIDRDPHRNGAYRKGADRESALYVNHVPGFFWEVLVEREHKHLSFVDETGFGGYIKGVLNRSYRGVDVAAPLLKRLKKGSQRGGGSTLLNMMIKNLYGSDNFFLQKENLRKVCPVWVSWNATLCRKLIEYRAARDLFPYLAQNDGEEFKRWVSTHVGLVGAVGNGAVYGIQGAAAVVFGKKPEQLNVAEQSLLAAAYKRDVRFAHPAFGSPRLIETRRKRWQERKKVAHVMANRIVARQGDSGLLAVLGAQFEQLNTPKVPRIPQVLKPYFASDVGDSEKQIKLYANLHTRLRHFMPSFQVLLERDLQLSMQQRKNGIPVEIVTTLPLQQDYEFRREIDRVLDRLARRYSFNKNLMFLDREMEGKAENVSVRISVAKTNGDMIRYYLREGSQAIEEKRGLQTIPLRPMASLAKIPLSALLVSKGLRPNDRLCNRYYRGLQNAGGDKGVRDCSKTFTFEASMARSKNLPLRYAANEKIAVSQQDLEKLFRDFGIAVDGAKSSRDNRIENLVFGRARATAAHMHQIMNKMVALVQTKHGIAQPLHTIQSVWHVIYEGMKRYEPIELEGVVKSDPLPAVGQYFNAPDAPAAMHRLLEAPIYSAGGTLSFTRNLHGGTMLLGKTGTLETENKNIKDKYVLGLLRVKGTLYTFLILVGSEDHGNGGGLIKTISTQQLMAPIIQAIVDSLNA